MSQMRGGGTGRQTGTRLTPANREGVEAYARQHGMSLNAAINKAIHEMLEADALDFTNGVGVSRSGERA